jgi:carbonic anhydrase/acetyltransferase-like protein (isoleucine patch superfamily)
MKKNNVVQIGVTFQSEGGDIQVGNYNVFEDKVLVYNPSPNQPLVIGDFNVISEGVKLIQSNIGKFNKIGVNCQLSNCNLIQGNIIGPLSKIK